MLSLFSAGQGENKVWYFGNQAGLNFNTNPPTALTNGVMNTTEGCASIATAAGSLLFYTDGSTVYNQSNATMANGTGLTGNFSTTQSALIVKQPGNTNIYFVFTVGAGGNAQLCYSIVDMSLASGQGSVTTKNVLVYANSTEKLTSVRHCNGVDVWVLYHEASPSTNYRATLVTSAGVGTTAVTSNIGTTQMIGYLKLSPNGKKMASAMYGNNCELYDFDASTGVVSNSLSLSFSFAYGCEFSPDGTKLYASSNLKIGQWDLCAGSGTAIAASLYTIATSSHWAMQLATDGKIYISVSSSSSLSTINSPNLAGSSMNFSLSNVSIAPKTGMLGLPNFITSGFKPPPPPYTYTVSNSYGCQGVAFTTPTTINTSTNIGCSSFGYSLVSQYWNFGDPASGAANTSTLANPIHTYPTIGTYTAMLVLNYSCGGGSDTIRQPINVNIPCISVTPSSITCSHLGSATVTAISGVGPFTYTWMPTGQTSSVASNLAPGSYTITVHDYGNNFTYTASVSFVSAIPLTGNVNTSSSITCYGANTGTANVTNFAGGSGTVTYQWFNTTTTLTSPTPSLTAGIWSLTVTDALTGCQINDVFYISQPPAQSMVLSASSPSTCAGTSVSLSGQTSGGTPYLTGAGYTYTWTAGPNTTTRVASQPVAGSYVYTLSSRDSLNCLISNTIAVNFVQNPVLTVSNVSICPLQTGTLNVSGATSYTWNNNPAYTGSSFWDNPTSNHQYTVLGSALGCTSTAMASIILKPLPAPLLNSNSPICNGQDLNLFGNGGVSYTWDGPLGYSSSAQYPVIQAASPANSGVYNLTVTAFNTCTASIQKTITVNPTPTVSAAGSTVCVNQSMSLTASSVTGALFHWTGPLSYTSSVQNPSISSPSVSNSGNYTVIATSAAGCTNTAITNASVTAMPIPMVSSTSPKCFGTLLSLSASGAGSGSYQWTGPNGFSSTLSNPQIANVSLAAAGVYSLQITLGPCVNNTVEAVTIFPLPAFNIVSNSPVCELHDLHLSSTAVGNATLYAWHGPAGFISQQAVNTRTLSDSTYAGIYTLTIIDANSCANTATQSIVINKNPVLVPVSTTVCLNQPATLSVSGAVSYSWTGPGYYQSFQANAFIPIASSSVTTQYTVMGQAANHCTTIANASLSTLSLPQPTLVVSPSNKVCMNKVVTLSGYGGQSYSWYGPGNFLAQGPNLTFTASAPSYAGIYTVVATDEKGCQAPATALLTLDLLPGGQLSGDPQSACVPFCSKFRFNPYGANVTSSWQLNRNTYTTPSFSACFTAAGTYTLTGMLLDTVHHCNSTMSLVIAGYALPVADFDYSPEVPVEDEEVSFINRSVGEGQQRWAWFFKTTDQLDSSGHENAHYTYSQSGTYPVVLEVRNQWGCSDTTIKIIRINQDLTVYIPNAFTPNGDGLNDIFLPVIRGIRLYHLQIFDRWGEKLFESNDIAHGWAGRYAGQDCKKDVYVWKISYSALDGTMNTINGTLMLER